MKTQFEQAYRRFAQRGNDLIIAAGFNQGVPVEAVAKEISAVTQKGNQVVSGIALNILASGLTAVLGNAWFHRGGQTPNLPAVARFMAIDLPGGSRVHNVPILGPLYCQLIGDHNLIVYAALAAVPVTQWIVAKTRFGLRLRAVGENPQAVDTAGISVEWLRYRSCGRPADRNGRRLSRDRPERRLHA